VRRALFPLLLLVPAMARPARTEAATWRLSGETVENRLVVSWDACPAGAREWEAFLSLDGGRSFPLRVTPHLGTAVRSFAWTIPRILAGDARLRIRFGDGTVEREYDVAGAWNLAPAPGARLLMPESRDLGESPAPGEEEAAAWVEWSGAEPRTVVPPSPRGFRPTSELRPAGIAKAALPSRRNAPAPPSARAEDAPARQTRFASRAAILPAPPLAHFSRLNV